jgi:hypothetical protein
LRRAIEADHRLVEHDDIERPNERAGDLCLLAHASGELPRQEVTSGCQSESF